MKEVHTVIEYIKKLLVPGTISEKPITQSDIGVVTPYKLQCKIIARECRKNDLKDVTIGTAEVFQGQERQVMIVSTVRSDGQLGFVSSPRVSPFVFCLQLHFVCLIFCFIFTANECNYHTCQGIADYRGRLQNAVHRSKLAKASLLLLR